MEKILEEENDFKNHFNYKDKNDYNYQYVKTANNIYTEELKFNGLNIKGNNKCIYIKQIKICFGTNYKKNEYMNILKEIYFLILLIIYEYLEKIDDILFLDESNDNKRLFLIFKDNLIELSSLIYVCTLNKNKNKENDIIINYLDNKNLIKWIIYQIAFGLYTLHYNNIIHNDIKPSNILINGEGGIKICISCSMNYKGEKSNLYSICHASPEFLNDENIIRDEKSDMWALGLIILELFLKTNNYLKINNKQSEEKEFNYKEENRKQLNLILSKFGINENISKEELNKIINDDNSNKEYSIILTKDEIEKIDDKYALDLINNLLVLNKNKRYSAEQVLNSKYLEEYSECCRQLDLPNLNNNKCILDKENNYNNYFSSPITNKEQFEKVYNELYSKLKELNKSN